MCDKACIQIQIQIGAKFRIRIKIPRIWIYRTTLVRWLYNTCSPFPTPLCYFLSICTLLTGSVSNPDSGVFWIRIQIQELKKDKKC